MSPVAIAKKAKSAGLDLVCLTDHNSALNCPAFNEVCIKNGITPFFGMEITSTEEVHCLAIFDKISDALELSEYIYKHLPELYNDPDRFGDQVYVDADENILGEVDKLLISAVDLSVENLKETVHSMGGLFIPAHIERPVNSLLSQLGFLPLDDYDAIELSKSYFIFEKTAIKNIEKYPIITNSDSHYTDTLGTVYNLLDMNEMTLISLKEALTRKKNRIYINEKLQ